MKIIKLSVDDINKYETEIISLLKQSFEKSFPHKTFTDDSFQLRLKSLKSYLEKDLANFYGSIHQEKLIGFIWFFTKENQTIHINHFVVDEQYRGLGVGKSLWDKVEEYAEINKLPDIELFVTKENESAVNFYEKRNFKVDRLLMKKRVF